MESTSEVVNSSDFKRIEVQKSAGRESELKEQSARQVLLQNDVPKVTRSGWPERGK